MADLLRDVKSVLTPAPASHVLSSLAPQLFNNRKILDAFHAHSLVGAATRPALRSSRVTARDLLILERTEELCSLQVPDEVASEVSLIEGFKASLPSALEARADRRKRRAKLVEKALELHELGLKEEVDRQRGLLSDDRSTLGARQKKKRGRKSALPMYDMLETTTKEELEQDLGSVQNDLRTIDIKRVSQPLFSFLKGRMLKRQWAAECCQRPDGRHRQKDQRTTSNT